MGLKRILTAFTAVLLICSAASASAPGPFGLGLKLESATSLHENDDTNRSAESALWLTPSIKLGSSDDAWKLGFLIVGTQATRPEPKSTLNNIETSVGGKWAKLSDVISLSGSFAAIAPTSEQAQKKDNYRGGVSIRPKLGLDFKSLGAPISGFYRPSFTEHVHEFERNADGEALSQRSVGHWFNTGAELGPVGISLDFIYTTAWTYQSSLKTKFTLAQELSYALNEKNSIYVGHSNEDNALRANGEDSNIRAFDANTSSIYAGLGIEF